MLKLYRKILVKKCSKIDLSPYHSRIVFYFSNSIKKNAYKQFPDRTVIPNKQAPAEAIAINDQSSPQHLEVPQNSSANITASDFP